MLCETARSLSTQAKVVFTVLMSDPSMRQFTFSHIRSKLTIFMSSMNEDNTSAVRHELLTVSINDKKSYFLAGPSGPS